MKCELGHIPNEKDLETAYGELLQSSVPTELFALYTQWSRFDPRLAQRWIDHLCHHWEVIYPVELRKKILRQPWPAAAAVLLEFSRKKMKDSVFNDWADVITTRMPTAADEQFFIGLRAVGGEAMIEDAQFSAAEYTRWGYLARENLLGKDRGTSYSVDVRQRILKKLAQERGRIRVRDYWEAIDQSVSLRQAERDLADTVWLKGKARTKGRYYVLKTMR